MHRIRFMRSRHLESHKSDRIGWLRAAVLGANDGIISIASLVVGVAASGASANVILLTGLAGTVAGAMSMAAGEYVSVQSQADTESADIEKEKKELISQPAQELEELTSIYMSRGLDRELAQQVAIKLMEVDAIGAHTRDELGISEALSAKPLQAAIASAISFTLGALVPIITVLLAPNQSIALFSTITALVALFILGGLAAYAGGASLLKGAVRMLFWGAAAIALTAGVGSLFGTNV